MARGGFGRRLVGVVFSVPRAVSDQASRRCSGRLDAVMDIIVVCLKK